MPAMLRRGNLCLLALALTLRAEERPFGPRELVSEMLQHNPEILAARSRFDAATKRPSQAGTLPDPKASYINLGVGHPLSRLNGSEFAYHGFGVSQEFPFPGKLALASEEAKREADSEREKYQSVILDVTSRLKVAYYEWLGLNKAIELTRKNSDLLGRFEEIARNRYAVGKGLQQDVLKAQLDVSTLEQQFAMLDEKRQRAEAEIASLLAEPNVVLRAPADIEPTAFTMPLGELLKRTWRLTPTSSGTTIPRNGRYGWFGDDSGVKTSLRPIYGVLGKWHPRGPGSAWARISPPNVPPTINGGLVAVAAWRRGTRVPAFHC